MSKPSFIIAMYDGLQPEADTLSISKDSSLVSEHLRGQQRKALQHLWQ
jgi:hypothetical protein